MMSVSYMFFLHHIFNVGLLKGCQLECKDSLSTHKAQEGSQTQSRYSTQLEHTQKLNILKFMIHCTV